MKRNAVLELNEIRAGGRPSPFFPGIYFLAAVKGKRSTGTSLISSYAGKVTNSDAVRKYVSRNIKKTPKTIKELRASRAIKNILKHPVFSRLSELITPKRLLALRRRSDESIWISTLLWRMQDDDIDVSLAVEYLNYLGKFEEALHKKWKKEGDDKALQILTPFLLIPKSQVDYLGSLSNKGDSEKLTEWVAFFDLIKLQNLYADLTRRCGWHLPQFEHIEKAELGNYTYYFFDRLLRESPSIDNWVTLLHKLDLKGRELDKRDFRAQRNAKHLISSDLLEDILSVLGAEELDRLGYYSAYCADWHYRNLNEKFRSMLTEVSMQERLDTALDRWNQYIVPNLSKASPLSES